MWGDANRVMPDGGAENELKKGHVSEPEGERGEMWCGGVGVTRFARPARRRRYPPAAGEDGDGYGDAEEGLGQSGMDDGDGGGKTELDGETAEEALHDDGDEGHGAEFAHPWTGFGFPEDYGEADGDQANEGGDHAVAVLVENAADHGRKEGAVGGGPVGDGQAGVVGGDESAGDQEEDGRGRREDGVAVDG